MNPSRLRNAALVLLVGAGGLAAVGCEDPYQSDPAAAPEHPAQPSAPAAPGSGDLPAPPESGELPGQAPSALLDEPSEFPEAGRTPERTLRLAARLYGNWTSASAGRQLERIAGLCVGQARAELRQAAAQAATDPQHRDVRARASVEAVAVDGSGAPRRALVVTRQRVRAPDLPDQGWRYQVTTAQVQRRGAKWVISKWSAQP
jgi:hypothetical protein